MTDPHIELAAAVRRALFLRDQAARAALGSNAAYEARTLASFYDSMTELERTFDRQPLDVRVPLGGDPVSMKALELVAPGPCVWEGADRGRD